MVTTTTTPDTAPPMVDASVAATSLINATKAEGGDRATAQTELTKLEIALTELPTGDTLDKAIRLSRKIYTALADNRLADANQYAQEVKSVLLSPLERLDKPVAVIAIEDEEDNTDGEDW